MEKEMSLWQLIVVCCKGIYKFVKLIIDYCLKLLRFSLKQWYVVMPIVVLFLLVGFWYSRPDNRRYKTQALVYLNGVKVEEVGNLYKLVQNCVPGGKIPSQDLSELLQIDADLVPSVSRFEIYRVIDYLNDSTADAVDFKRRHQPTDTINVLMSNCICLEFCTKQPDRAIEVGESLLDFLNNQPLMQDAFQSYKQQLLTESQIYHSQIEMLDTVSRNFYMQHAGKKQVAAEPWTSSLVVGKRELVMLTPQIKELLVEASLVDKSLVRCTAPLTTDGFVVVAKPVNGRVKVLIWALILGYFFGCAVALLFARRKEIAVWLHD